MARTRKTEKDLRCPLEYGLDAISGKWKTRIMRALKGQRALRFTELQDAMQPVSSVALSDALKELVGLGLVERIQFNEIPPHVEYALTEKADSLFPILEQLCLWAYEHHPTILREGMLGCHACRAIPIGHPAHPSP